MTCLLDVPEIDSSLTNECNAAITYTEHCITNEFPPGFYPACDSDKDAEFLANLDQSGFRSFQGPITTGNTVVYYGLVEQKMNWEDGNRYCQGLNLTMGQVHSQTENSFLFFMPGGFGNNIWIGGTANF